MFHDTPLLSILVIGLLLACILGTLVRRFKISSIVGYLLAGILVGPHTPGFVADQSIALELAEIGVILLMFGVGLHFSLKDLVSVRAIAIPGAIGQVAFSSLLGFGLAYAMGWSQGAGLVFGLALSVASTVVLMRHLRECKLFDTDHGKIAIGWLIVQDIMMIFVLVLLPAIVPLLNEQTIQKDLSIAEAQNLAVTLGITLGKVVAFVVLMLVLGRRIIPIVLHFVDETGSRELFRLCVLSIALSVAFIAAKLFGVSFALGAFFAGMILSESKLSRRAAEETLPLRDAFAVLFFISIGMLFNPDIILHQPWHVAVTVCVIMLGQSVTALAMMVMFRQKMEAALFIASCLGQIGELSFILAEQGVSLGVLDEQGRDLIMAGAMISIFLNPVLFYIFKTLRRPEIPDAKTL